jgi:hypothetical protein
LTVSGCRLVAFMLMRSVTFLEQAQLRNTSNGSA